MISYSRQTITKQDVNEVSRVLKSEWLTTGPSVASFEKHVAKFVGAKYAVAVVNGTAALHAACFAAGIEKGDQVITTPYSFAATANCVLYQGARPVFVDIDRNSLSINVTKIQKRISTKTKSLIAVDFAGLPAEWNELNKISREHKLVLIADAAHSLGARYKGKMIGTQADLTCFSFHPVKTITTGEGGMIVTNKKKYYEKLKIFRNHGIKKEGGRRFEKQPWYYEMTDLGYNYRLTDLQSALGISQLRQAQRFVKHRTRLAKRYTLAFQGIDHVYTPIEFKDRRSAWHLYPLRIDFKRVLKTKTELFAYMLRRGVKLQVHYIPIHLQPFYRKSFGYQKGDYPVSELVYSQEVSLPLYPSLSMKQQDKVIQLVKEFVG